jgi:hypothetical protein
MRDVRESTKVHDACEDTAKLLAEMRAAGLVPESDLTEAEKALGQLNAVTGERLTSLFAAQLEGRAKALPATYAALVKGRALLDDAAADPERTLAEAEDHDHDGGACGCGGSCGPCKANTEGEACVAASNAIRELDREHDALLASLRTSKGLRALGKSMFAAGGPYMPQADLEAGEESARRRLDALVERRNAVLAALCEMCPDDGLCHLPEGAVAR